MQSQAFFCTTTQFEQLLDVIKNAGYKLLGPKVRDEVIIYDELTSAKDLPIGWTDEQDPGKYRLKRRNDKAYFGYNVGPHSWKKYLFPPKEIVWSAKKDSEGHLSFQEEPVADQKMAFIGVRACEIQGIFILDKVYNNKVAVNDQYQKRRQNTFIMAVTCTTAVNTCFCASMGTGPAIKEGYDLALTEVVNGSNHYFLLTIGSERGKSMCQSLKLRPCTSDECAIGAKCVQGIAEKMIRKVDNPHIHEVLMNSYGSNQWKEVAQRCLNCTNCTLVCPTCFCSNTFDNVSIDGTQSSRCQMWESCFNLSHSYVHGGSVRSSAESRYRQWLTHKFGTWWDQFGVSGCIGCGRCITWCPVGIDVTEELAKLQKEQLEKR